jgi:hypothetical protein
MPGNSPTSTASNASHSVTGHGADLFRRDRDPGIPVDEAILQLSSRPQAKNAFNASDGLDTTARRAG